MIRNFKKLILSTKGSFTPQSICGGLLSFILLYLINLNENIVNWMTKYIYENPVKGAILPISILAIGMVISNLLFLFFKKI